MPARPYWKGHLKLSLVVCPVVLFPASSLAERTHFHQINKATKHRLRQQMVDEETGAVVEGDQKGRGYELDKGRYVEIEEDELKAVRLESTHTIDIDSFVAREEIDPRYRDKPYYIAPDGKSGLDAFAVIRDAMKTSDRVAIARIVMGNREHPIAIEPFDKGFLGTTLRYPYELRDADDYVGAIPQPKVTRDMVTLAQHIIESKSARFDPSAFEDRYEEALRTLVKRKAAGKPLAVQEEPPPRGNVVDLMAALRQSLEADERRPRARSSRPRRKRAA